MYMEYTSIVYIEWKLATCIFNGTVFILVVVNINDLHFVFVLDELNQYVTVMICVAVKGKPILGIINHPYDTEFYSHETGE